MKFELGDTILFEREGLNLDESRDRKSGFIFKTYDTTFNKKKVRMYDIRYNYGRMWKYGIVESQEFSVGVTVLIEKIKYKHRIFL